MTTPILPDTMTEHRSQELLTSLTLVASHLREAASELPMPRPTDFSIDLSFINAMKEWKWHRKLIHEVLSGIDATRKAITEPK